MEPKNTELFANLLSGQYQSPVATDSVTSDAAALAAIPALTKEPSLNVTSLMEGAPTLSFFGKWRLGAAYTEAERQQLKSVLGTRNRLLLDKLDILEKQSKAFRDYSIATVVESALLQAEQDLGNLRRERNNLRNKQIDRYYEQYVEDISAVEANGNLPEQLKRKRQEQLTQDFLAATTSVREGMVLKRYGFE